MATDHDAQRAGRRNGKQWKDPNGGHTRLYWRMQDSVAWQALSFTAKCLWLALRRRMKSPRDNGNIEATAASLRHHGFGSSATIAKCLRELQTLGFIDKTRQGGIANGGKLCSLFRFTDLPVLETPSKKLHAWPATNDWDAWANLASAEAAIERAHSDARRRAHPQAATGTKLRTLKRTDSTGEPDEHSSASRSEAQTSGQLQSLKRIGAH